MQDENRIIHLWKDILKYAIDRNATDIHIEPFNEYTLIRCRIDGALQTFKKICANWHDHLTAHIKIQAALDIAEKRLPQDGRLSFNAIDCRVSSIPTLNGEKIVVRILIQDQNQLNIYQLGYTQHQIKIIEDLIKEPQGLILVTGPTGSGKTLTLYSFLNYLNDGTKNISSVEDPIEIRLTGINQIAVNEKIGLDFPLVLKALLRQDPDVLLIGEIRDTKTAQIALQAAQTGHLVFASLHTNTALSSISRLINLGCDKELIANCLLFVGAQRLIRKICSQCLCKISNQQHCSLCKSSGFTGRVAVHEIIKINQEMREEIYNGDLSNLYKIAKYSGFKTLNECAMEMVTRNLCTIDEVNRQIGQFH